MNALKEKITLPTDEVHRELLRGKLNDFNDNLAKLVMKYGIQFQEPTLNIEVSRDYSRLYFASNLLELLILNGEITVEDYNSQAKLFSGKQYEGDRTGILDVVCENLSGYADPSSGPEALRKFRKKRPTS